MGRLRTIADAVSTFALLAMCATVITVNWPRVRMILEGSSVRVPDKPVSYDGAEIKGDPSARVAMIVFSDFQCPFCASFARDVLPTIEEKYLRTGKALVVFRHNPIERIHPLALGAAVAAKCAGRQAGFWRMHDALFEKGRTLDSPSIDATAQSIGIRLEDFATCIDAAEVRDLVRADATMAKGLGLRGTPGFLLGLVLSNKEIKVTHAFAGVRPIAEFARVLDELGKTAETGTGAR